MKMKKTLLVLVAALCLVISVTPAYSAQFTFVNISNNSGIASSVASQLLVDVIDSGANVDFKFTNAVGTASSITDIYFDQVLALFTGISSISDSGAGVAFASPASPADLPEGGTIGFTADFSADSDSPPSPNGVDAASEWVTISLALGSGTYADIINALNSGALRVGLHVQAIGINEDSDAFVNTPVPEPGFYGLLSLGLGGLYLLRRRKTV